MIRGYTDQSANERTFLAWVRTGIAVTAFGLFVEKFELLSAAPAVTSAPDPAVGLPLTALARAIERYDGLALAVLGVAVIILAAVSFVRIQRQLGDADMHRNRSALLAVVFSAALALIILNVGAYVVLA
jgi:putative membrane protein